MSDWAVSYVYDSRFGSLIMRVGNGKEESPPFSIRLADVLRAVPDYEIRQLMEMAKQPKREYLGIEAVRQRAIQDLDCQGKFVLDIGGYSGDFAKLCLDKGASRAIVVDPEQWRHYGWEEIRLPGVEYMKADLTAWTEPADIVIAFNILYHTHHPWQMLSHLRKITRPDGVMLLCTLFRYHDGAWMYVYESRECNKDDETVYFGPSILALERLLTHTGWAFKQDGLQDDRVVYKCWPDPNWTNKHPEPGD